MIRTLFILLVTLILGACSSTIQVVDNKGNPIEDVIVISEKIPMFSPWEIGLSITDTRGKATVVNHHGEIFKAGYFPVIDGSTINRGWGRDENTYFSNKTVLYPIKKNMQIDTDISEYITKNPIKDSIYKIPLTACKQKNIYYNAENSIIEVISNQKDILLSKRFYFVGATSNEKVQQAKKEDELAFYCTDNNKLYKVGLNVAVKVSNKSIPKHKILIFTAQVPSTAAYIQPKIKCATERIHHRYGANNKGTSNEQQAKLYLADNALNKLEKLKTTIPCYNEHTEKLFNYVKKMAELYAK